MSSMNFIHLGYSAVDETDAMSSEHVDLETSRSLSQLATILREDLARIITFSNDEMQVRQHFRLKDVRV